MAKKLWLEIQREVGDPETRTVTVDGSIFTAEMSCPGCRAQPFKLRQVTNKVRYSEELYRAGAECIACGDPVGYVYEKPDTIFGIDEDERVLAGPWRVY